MKRKFGIRAKLMVGTLPIIFLAFVVVVVIAYNSSKGSIEQKTEKLLESDTATCVNSIVAWENDNLGVLQNAVDTIVNLDMDREEILEYESFYLETYEDFPNGIYIGNEAGEIYDATGWEPEGDLTQKSWYLEGMNHDSMAFGEPYQDSLTGGYVVTASCNRMIEGKRAVIATDISIDILSTVVSELEVEGQGDAFVFDTETGVILAHKNAELMASSINEIADSYYSSVYDLVKAGDYSTASVKSNEGIYMTAMRPIDGTSWVIIVRALEDNIYRDVARLGGILGAVGIFAIIIVIVTLVLVIHRIVTPIHKLTDSIVAITDGDFTTEVDTKGNDEVAIMAGSLSRFLDVMRITLSSIINISDQIDDQAKGSNEVSGELHESANGQAEAMDQMRQNLEELVKSIGVIAENATSLAIIVADTDEAGAQAIDHINETMTEADEGRNSMESVNMSMEQMKKGLDLLEKSITDVGEAAIKIDEITATISGIAEETNLLALNASIEAARAGEAGKGFAVVATEIKNLAETSSHAAGEISELISSVTTLINSTVEQSQNSVVQIKESSQIVGVASEQFNNIFESIEKTNTIIHGMIDKVRNANDVASNMAAITEEQSASAEEIEATAINIQELANVVTENSANVKKDSNVLANTAESLKEEVSGFTI